MSRYDKDLYEFYKRNKICVNCGQEKAVSNRVRCFECLEKGRERARARVLAETSEQREIRLAKMKEYRKNRIEKLKEQGLCINCRKPQCSLSTVYCIDCAIKNQRRNNKRKTGIDRNERKNYRMCYICGEHLIHKQNALCDKCYAMVCANLHKKMNQTVYMIHKSQNKAIFRN